MKIFLEYPPFLKIGHKCGTIYIRNQVVFFCSDECYWQKDPLFNGRGISFVMLSEVVKINLVYANLSRHVKIVLKFSGFEVICRFVNTNFS